MAAIAPITINDGAVTPVAHTFNPVRTNAPDTVWRDTIAGIALAGEPLIKLRQTYDRKSGLTRTKINVLLPVLETVGSQNAAGYTAAPKIAHTVTFNLEFISHDRSVTQNRKDVRSFVINLLANSQVIDAIDNVVVPY